MERYDGGFILKIFLFKVQITFQDWWNWESCFKGNITSSNIRGCEDQEELSTGKEIISLYFGNWNDIIYFVFI